MSLLGLAGRLAQPLLMATDPEMGHHLAVQALKVMPIPACKADDPILKVSAFGMDFPNPVGMAAGFDKQAEVPDAVLRLGFGHVEVGGVTPLPQPGNPRPRVFRLVADEGIINRYGLNSEGMVAVTARLAARRSRGGIVGVNFGPNKETKDRIADYAAMASLFAPVVDYLSVNVSSPNTPGLRDLQQVAALDEIIARVSEAAKAAVLGRSVPILVKIAPDLALADLDDLVAMAVKRGIDGMIVSNTTISRPASLRDQTRAKEAGGLSGKPVFDLSTRMLAETYRRVEGRFPLVGVGGVDSAETAFIKITAGASLIQLYSALIYKGLGLVGEIKTGLAARLKKEGLTSVAQAVGRNAEAWRMQV